MKTIFEFPKNSRERFRICIRRRQRDEQPFVDVRVLAKDASGEFVTTPHGLSIKPEALRNIIEALEEAEKRAVAEGLIPGGAP
jgi:hypothetical protein